MPKQTETEAEREVRYPNVGDKLYLGETALTDEEAKRTLLNWETEKDYIARQSARLDEEKRKGLDLRFDPDDVNYPPPFVDINGDRVRCWASCRNRPFKMSHALKLCQVILNRQWRFNGETVIVGRYGEVLSGQHRLIALVLACQKWAKDDEEGAHWRKLWPSKPTIETLVVFGVPEDDETVGTLDNTMPRDENDVFYTSSYFRDLKPRERQECSRYQAKAVRFLWKRLGFADEKRNEYQHYLTNMAAVNFVDRHKSLMKCVRHLFDVNKDRGVSALHLSAGECTGALYLMATGGSTQTAYYLAKGGPSEKALVWDDGLFAKGQQFFASLSKCGPEDPVRKALGDLLDADDPVGGRATEKMCVLAKAWARYAAGEPVFLSADEPLARRREVEAALKVQSAVVDGQRRLVEWPDFGGADLGPVRQEPPAGRNGDTVPPTEGETGAEQERLRKGKVPLNEEEKARVRKEKADKLLAQREARKRAKEGEQVEGLTEAGRAAQAAQLAAGATGQRAAVVAAPAAELPDGTPDPNAAAANGEGAPEKSAPRPRKRNGK